MLAPLLTALIVLVYALSLWWLLRRESARSLLAIVGLCGVAVALRLFEAADYPRGLNEDEAKILWCSARALSMGDLFGQGCTGMPLLLSNLFEAQLIPWLGAGRWAIRAYSMATSVLSVPVAFAVARSMRLRMMPSLAAGAFVAVLPWAIFYGRVHQGGELLFHQLLVLAAVARLIWAAGGWVDVLIGSFGLCLLFHDYFSGRTMLAMPLMGFVLAQGRRRWLCLVIPVVAFLGWLPHLLGGHEYALVGLSALELHPEYERGWWATLSTKTANTVFALAWPIAHNGWLTIRAAAVHPWTMLVLAGIGSVTGWRRALFLWSGFVAGLMPSILAHGPLLASTHRMHSAYVFVALAAACALNIIPWRVARGLVTSAVVLFVGAQSILFYFSDAFWPPESRWIFDWERSEVVEAIPVPPPQRIIATDLGYYILMRSDLEAAAEELSVENWIPTGRATYLFGWRTSPLQAFYLNLLGPRHVQQVGRGFAVNVDGGDWSWLKQFGWNYEARCPNGVQQGHVPTLFHVYYSFRNPACGDQVEHVWRGRWLWHPATLRLRFSGKAMVETPTGVIAEHKGFEQTLDFKVEPGSDVTIHVTGVQNPLAALYVVTRTGERLPYWEWVAPVPAAGQPADAAQGEK